MESLTERLTDKVKLVTGCAPAALTSTAGDGDYVSLKGYRKCTIVISILNGATVTGGTITLLQATTVAAGSAKALAFSTALRNIDCAASDALAAFTVSSDTFTTDTTNAKQLMYVIDVDADDLDVAGGFDCLRVDSTGMANAVGCILYVLHPMRYSSAPSAIVD